MTSSLHISSHVACALAGAALTLASCVTTDVPDVSLFQDGVTRQTLAVSGATGRVCKDTLGYAYPAAAISWQQLAAGRVWELTTKGKHGPIVSQFEVRDGRIVRSRIHSSKERRGRQITSRSYLRQFEGFSLVADGTPSKRVDGITGATVSSRAVESAALLALRLDGLVPAGTE